MIDLFTSALSDCQNAFSILCEVFNSIEEVTLSIVRELKGGFPVMAETTRKLAASTR